MKQYSQLSELEIYGTINSMVQMMVQAWAECTGEEHCPAQAYSDLQQQRSGKCLSNHMIRLKIFLS